jgi:hypothetical protein
MALKQMRSRRTAKSVINCQGSLVDLDIFYAFFGLQDIAGYCRILQDIAGLLSLLLSFIATLLLLLLPDPPGFPKMCQSRPS